jgi:16S rRNA (guanine966-N2)-methyltransferase
MRESLFNILAHGLEFELEGARVLDLFAGTGANAIESLSRGASFAVMVDIGAEARGLQRENVEALGLGGVTRILRRDATKLGEVSPFTPFDLVFCDPPYGKELGEAALASALRGGWLAPRALVVLEERANVAVALPAALIEFDRRKAGETQLIFGRVPE